MALRRDQIGRDRRIINSNWRWLKQQTNRWLRRIAKRLLEDAPKRRVYRGWAA